jgi:hypothetical protein
MKGIVSVVEERAPPTMTARRASILYFIVSSMFSEINFSARKALRQEARQNETGELA